ncbi:hypothetical protein EYF80_019893 [Liparis tanakae]|uniref:Uncharacterized protein n=1 Tax=Liparis tanakae TaxID=230148 RepID=A0A4Z2HWW3_9TELE|nr:hypothetical protein EYF80_019893 [Liparis tanakae]
MIHHLLMYPVRLSILRTRYCTSLLCCSFSKSSSSSKESLSRVSLHRLKLSLQRLGPLDTVEPVGLTAMELLLQIHPWEGKKFSV